MDEHVDALHSRLRNRYMRVVVDGRVQHRALELVAIRRDVGTTARVLFLASDIDFKGIVYNFFCNKYQVTATTSTG